LDIYDDDGKLNYEMKSLIKRPKWRR